MSKLIRDLPLHKKMGKDKGKTGVMKKLRNEKKLEKRKGEKRRMRITSSFSRVLSVKSGRSFQRLRCSHFDIERWEYLTEAATEDLGGRERVGMCGKRRKGE